MNISSGTSWDPAYTPHTANDSALATATAQIFLSTLRYARTKGYTAPLPLLVFSAGNYPSSNVDAFYSGYPQLHDSLPDSILTVGAMSKTRALSSFSARNVSHQFVDIVAPGEDIYALDSGDALVSVSGTSFAAPQVTGIGGMLLSFDSRLLAPSGIWGPPELRRLILAGADSSRNVVTGARRQAGGIRIADAYESLKEAARRPGAPLCGNKLWGNFTLGQLIADRGTGTEVISSVSPNVVYDPAVFHGGKQITFAMGLHRDAGQGFEFEGYHFLCEVLSWNVNASWDVSGPRCDSQDSTVGTGLLPLSGSYAGTYWSALGKSHNGDSTITIERCAGTDSTCFNANLETPSGTHVLTTFHRPGYLTDNYQIGIYSTVAYSPYGDRALVAFSAIVDSEFTESAIPYIINAQVYSIKISNGHVDSLPSWNAGTRGILSIGISEDGQW